MPRHLGPGGGPSCLGIWVPPGPKIGGGGGGGGGGDPHGPVNKYMYY